MKTWEKHLYRKAHDTIRKREFEFLSGCQIKDPVLDFGCGAGQVTHFLRQLGHTDIDAFEPNPHMRERAKKNGVSPASEIPQRKYNTVVCVEVIQEVAAVDSFLRTLDERLLPGGRLIIIYLNSYNLFSWALVAKDGDHTHSLGSIRNGLPGYKLITKSGCQILPHISPFNINRPAVLAKWVMLELEKRRE